MVAAAFRVGLRVADLTAASEFYRGLGFIDVGSVPGPDGDPVMTILDRRGAHLLVEALVGMPFPDSSWERETQRGPRGRGVTLGVAVDDRAALDRTVSFARAAGATVNSEPEPHPWVTTSPRSSIRGATCGSCPRPPRASTHPAPIRRPTAWRPRPGPGSPTERGTRRT